MVLILSINMKKTFIPTFWVLIFMLFVILACKQKKATNEQAIKSELISEAVIKQEGKDRYLLTSFDGTKISYRDINKENNFDEPVLLIHGFISDGNSWNGTVLKEELQRMGVRLIIPDLRGNGKSDQPKNDDAYKDWAEVKDLEALMSALNIGRHKAVGYSRGAIILSAYLSRNDNVSHAVVGGMGLDFIDPAWSRRVAFQKGFEGNTEEYPETKGAVDYAKKSGADLHIMSLLQKYQPSPSEEALAKIRSHVLVIAGDQDLSNGDPEDLSEKIPSAQLKIVAGDHNTTYRKESFANEVLSFLKIE